MSRSIITKLLPDGSPTNWAEIDQLGLCANFGKPAGEARIWKGAAPRFLRVAWGR